MSDKKEEKSWLERIVDAISEREAEADPQSRVGRGGRKRADKILADVDRMARGQSTDSNN